MPTTQTWTGSAGTGNWGDSGNWSGGQLPSTLDAVVFNSGPAATLASTDLDNIASLTMSSASASLDIQGSLNIGTAFLNGVSNTINVTQGSLTVDGGSLTAGQYVTAASGTVHLINGGSYLWQGSGSTQTVDMGQDVNNSFVFTSQFGGTISNFQAGQFITFSGAVNSVTVGNDLISFNAADGNTYNIQLTGSYDASNLIVSGNSIQTTAVCFAQDTLILTIHGEVPVQSLSVGDEVITASGERKPIIWIGYRHLWHEDLNAHEFNRPISVQAGAFGANMPHRELILSPSHSVCVTVDGLEYFIPICHLLNGTSVRMLDVRRITYWHVELSSHDVVIANGMPAESYLDCGNRHWFSHRIGQADAMLDTSDMAGFCRPVLLDSPLIEHVRVQLQDRLPLIGWRIVRDMDPHLMVDGMRINPVVEEDRLSFVVPAQSQHVVLMSQTFKPYLHCVGNYDPRTLGLMIKGIQIKPAYGKTRHIPIDHFSFVAGFHAVEFDQIARRWTNGALPLTKALWKNTKASFVVEFLVEPDSPYRWVYQDEVIEPGSAVMLEPLKQIA